MEQVRSPGFRFARGRLHLFGRDGEVMVIGSWPELRAVRRQPDESGWTPFEPAFRLVRPYRGDRPRRAAAAPPPAQLEFGFVPETVVARPTRAQLRKRAFDGFRFALPKEVAKHAERFGSHQWRLLQLFRARERTLELAAQSPALAFCLANANRLRRRGATLGLSVEWSERRQREILGWLGFPDSEGAARIVARIVPEAVHVPGMIRIRPALADPEARQMLAHLPSIHAGALGLVVDPELRAGVTPKLLAEVAASPDEKYRAGTGRQLADVRTMARQLGRDDVPPRFFSIARLREVHRELSVEFCRLRPEDARAVRFPPPPLPGTPDIVPLRTPGDLMDEGSEQDHCVASYIPDVAAKDVYIYRVLRPQRATLSITRAPDGAWQVDQLALRANGRPGRATWARVESWLAMYSLSA
jgi:hypothetical protein